MSIKNIQNYFKLLLTASILCILSGCNSEAPWSPMYEAKARVYGEEYCKDSGGTWSTRHYTRRNLANDEYYYSIVVQCKYGKYKEVYVEELDKINSARVKEVLDKMYK